MVDWNVIAAHGTDGVAGDSQGNNTQTFYGYLRFLKYRAVHLEWCATTTILYSTIRKSTSAADPQGQAHLLARQSIAIFERGDFNDRHNGTRLVYPVAPRIRQLIATTLKVYLGVRLTPQSVFSRL